MRQTGPGPRSVCCVADNPLEDEWDALTRRLDSELVDDEETLLHDSMVALRALAQHDDAEAPGASNQTSHEDSELDRVLAALHKQSSDSDVNSKQSAPDKPDAGSDRKQPGSRSRDGTKSRPDTSTRSAIRPKPGTSKQASTNTKTASETRTKADAQPAVAKAARGNKQTSNAADKPTAGDEDARLTDTPEADSERGVSTNGVSPRSNDKRSGVAASAPHVTTDLDEQDQQEAAGPGLMADWVHSTGESPIIRDDQSLTEVLGAAATDEHETVNLATVTEHQHTDHQFASVPDERPATFRRAVNPDHAPGPNAFPRYERAESVAMQSDQVPGSIEASHLEQTARKEVARKETARKETAQEKTVPGGPAGEIVAVGAARLQPVHAQIPTVTRNPVPDSSTETGVPTTLAPSRTRPPSPWAPRIAAMTGMAILIAGSAVLWISLLGTPGGSGEEPTGSGTLASNIAVEEAIVGADSGTVSVPTEEVQNATLIVNDDKIEATITSCGTAGVQGELATDGSEWLTASVQAAFQTAEGDLLTESQPQEELVPTTIRVPFRFTYDQSLAPVGLQGELPHCVVTVDLISQP